MRPINVSLDATTWELAKKKPNFSQWVRDKLRSEDNKKRLHEQRPNHNKECVLQCGEARFGDSLYCYKHMRIHEDKWVIVEEEE